MSKIENLLNMLNSNTLVAYDVETSGLKWQNCYVCGYSVSDGQSAYYVPVRHEAGGNISHVDAFEREVAEAIKQRKKPLIGHNIKFDSHFSLNHKIELGDNIIDTMVAAALLDENARSYSLASVASKYPDIPQKLGSELVSHIIGSFPDLPINKRNAMGAYYKLHGNDPLAVEYAEADTLATWHVWDKQRKEIYGQNLDFVFNLECRLLHVLRKLERRGIKIDIEEVERVKQKVEELQLEAYSNIPLKDDLMPINLRSNKDLQEYFLMHEFSDWEMTKPTERHPDGQPSFNKAFLNTNEPGKILLDARAIDHFKSSFVDPIDDYIHNDTMHTNYNTTMSEFGGTRTGRLSCNSPNMTQIPKRDEKLGRIFRKIFVASKGYTFVEFDYSQAEPRLFTHYSGEPVLMHGYQQTPAIDMHDVAAKYLRVSRKVAKNLNLGLQYTMGVAKLAKQLAVSENTAREMYYSWKKTFPKVSDFTKLASQVAENRGYVKTILGRRARVPDQRFSYRAANRIVQGGAADILKYSMVKIDEFLVANKLETDVRMLLNIHDAILFEIKDDILEEYIPILKSMMEDVQKAPFNLKVPFVAEYQKGKDWAEASYGAH